MFRFTIRDLLWLMAVVGLGLALCCSGVPEMERLRNENNDLERRMMKLAQDWAKEKGKPVSIDTGRNVMEFRPDGTGTLFNRAAPDSH